MDSLGGTRASTASPGTTLPAPHPPRGASDLTVEDFLQSSNSSPQPPSQRWGRGLRLTVTCPIPGQSRAHPESPPGKNSG